MEDIYRNPGPLQFDGPGADSRTFSLHIQDLDYMGRIKELNAYLEKVISTHLYENGSIQMYFTDNVGQTSHKCVFKCLQPLKSL